jgi:catechol 2,3-dioxygenase-like lactoylglutathione lyase family enzyme
MAGVELRHLGLPVADSDRSLHFYATYFGFDPATARHFPDGTTIVRNADGFDLAFHPTSESSATEGFLHFGFRVADPGRVHAVRKQLEGDGVLIVEIDDEADLVSFKCLDPDGWRVEIYWVREA